MPRDDGELVEPLCEPLEPLHDDDQVEVAQASSAWSGLLHPKKRYILVAMLWLGLFNVYAMRVNISEASLPMQTTYNWSDRTQG